MAELKKGASFWAVLALAVASISGTGVFFGTAIGSRYAGNLVIVSWIILSIIALYVAACFGELVALFPKSGGVYEYGKQTYGRFVSFIIGWVAWLFGSLGIVLLIIAAVNYLFPTASMALKMGIGIFFILFLNLVAFVGLGVSSFVLILLVAITLSVLVFIVAKGFFFFDSSNLTLFFATPYAGYGGPFVAIFIALFFLVEGFFGWEGVTYLSEETLNPRKMIPKALMIATGCVAFIGLLIYVVSLGIIPWQTLSSSTAPLIDVSNKIFGGIGRLTVSVGIFLSLIASAAGGIITMPRLLLALARDRLFLGQLKEIHKRFKTPHKAILFQTIVLLILLFLGFGNYKTLLSMLVPMGLFVYALTMLALVVLRFQKPDMQRPFKVVFGKTGPVVIVIFFLLITAAWLVTEPGAINLFWLSASIVALGLPLYFLVELYYDPKMITSVNDLFSYFSVITERLTMPKKIVDEIFVLLGDIKGKKVLDFGCSTGTLTIPLSREAGKNGFVHAIDFSKNAIKIASRRIKLKQWETTTGEYNNVKFIHDPENMIRVHPDIRRVDAVVSVGRLSYMQDVKRVLMELYSVLTPDGKICFVEYGDFFHVIPNVEWMAHNKTIERLFREAGFAVHVLRRKGLFWNYIFIYGAKLGGETAYI